MMRSLYSGVAGLKTHQVKMDVIGNNIANVNTTAYKAQTITFNELMYQTTKRASGASADTGVGGTNAGQIGLGVKVGAINTNISSQGAMQTTNLPFDIAITGDSFFIVSNGFENFFTRAGSFYVDGAGNLAMTSTGYNVMGWTVDPENPNNIKKDTVSALRVMHEGNMTYEAEATTKATVAGVIDRNDVDLRSTTGKIMNLEFFDDQGFKYTARLSTHVINADRGEYYTKLVDVLDSNGRSIGPDKLALVNFGTDKLVETFQSVLRTTGVNTRQAITLVNNSVSPAVDAFTIQTNTDYTPATLATAGGTITVSGTPPVATGPVATIFGSDAAVAANTAHTITFDANGNMFVTATAGATPVRYNKLPGQTNLTRAVTLINSNSTATPLPEFNFAATANINSNPSRYIVAANGDITVPTPTPAPNPAPTSPIDASMIRELYGIDIVAMNVREFIIDTSGNFVITRKLVADAAVMRYDPGNGRFVDIDGNPEGMLSIRFNQTSTTVDMTNFKDIEVNFLNTLTNNNNGKSTISASAGGAGAERGLGTGRRKGDMIEIVVQDDGRIYANYDNGMSRLLAQIAVATFANPSGLEKKGDNLYAATMNSGAFDGIGDDIKNGGGYMTSGVLEMSNVDLSSEFTEMITTQRGFQANSRIITVSDSLLEELTNLKR